MFEDTLGASVADRGGSIVDLLRHRADEAGILVRLAPDDPLSEIEIGQNAVQWVVRLVIGRAGKQGAGRFGPIVGSRHAKRILRLEVVKERTLRDPCRFAKIIHRGRGKAFLSDHVTGGFQKSRSRIAALGRLFGWSRHG